MPEEGEEGQPPFSVLILEGFDRLPIQRLNGGALWAMCIRMLMKGKARVDD